MGLILLLALLVVLFGAAGFALHVLWIAAVIMLVIWAFGFFAGPAVGGGRGYYRRGW